MSNEHCESLLRQRDALRDSLNLIAEQKMRYVSPTDIPPQLLKDERYWERELAAIEQEIKEQCSSDLSDKPADQVNNSPLYIEQPAAREAQRPAPTLPRSAPTSSLPVIPAPQPNGGRRWWFIIGVGMIAIIGTLVALGWGEQQQTASVPTLQPAAATVGGAVEPTAVPTTGSESPTATPQPFEPLVEIAPGVSLELVEVPAGIFLMGSSDADPDAEPNEKPQHELYLDTFAIGKTEVTNAQFRPFVEGDGYTNPAYWTAESWAWREEQNRIAPYFWNDPERNGDLQPVVGATWYEATAYAAWLGAQTGGDYRLPSEAEWEKAACGTDTRRYPWGDEPPDSARANFADIIGSTTPVGSFVAGASPYGALDMAGNVWEWTRSVYCSDTDRCDETRFAYAYDPDDGRESSANASQKRFTLRGGSWRDGAWQVRCGSLGSVHPVNGGDYINNGFRVVCAPCLR